MGLEVADQTGDLWDLDLMISTIVNKERVNIIAARAKGRTTRAKGHETAYKGNERHIPPIIRIFKAQKRNEVNFDYLGIKFKKIEIEYSLNCHFNPYIPRLKPSANKMSQQYLQKKCE